MSTEVDETEQAEQAEQAKKADRYREMASIIGAFAPDDREYATAIEGLYFNRRSAPTQPVHAAQWPCFALVIQGEKTLALGDEIYRYGAGDALLVSLDVPVVSRVSVATAEHPHLGLGLAIRPEPLREVFTRVAALRPLPAPDGTRGVAVLPAGAELLDACLRLLRLLERPDDIAVMAPLIEQEILYRILTGPAGPRLLQLTMEQTPGNRIARATAWLREHFRQPLRIAELAGQVGMSESSLHHHFRAVTAMTPVQYQKRLRLHEARRLMLMERLDVGTAGHRVGYESPSQFSREYARLYGVSPLRDIEAVRKGEGIGAASGRAGVTPAGGP